MGTLNLSPPLLEGRAYPLGARWDGAGVNFALFSAHAERVELCLFDGSAMHALPLPCCTDQVWHGYLPGAGPGQVYAYRVIGPAAPGHCFDPQLFLLDPYAREVSGSFSYAEPPSADNSLKARVVDETFDWGDDAPPDTPLAETILYEIHVKGATRLHPEVPKNLRGTYAGLATPPMLKHFSKLGITAVKLMPVHFFLDEKNLLDKGRINYWGYNTLAFFALEPRYATRHSGESATHEFRTMVRTLHAAGIEVILDVVFNHTAETDENGPTLSFRGIDNASYYRLPANAPTRYENFSGCGNTLNLAHPRVLQLVMDALRYWVGEMHVDGFRFDLAVALTRDSGFLAAIRQDPLLAGVKMIAEPWDLGPDGYRLGSFPPGWSEKNDRFRDDVRAFWLTGGTGISGLARRLAGSRETFQPTGRPPQAGLNFITLHDGFTLRDLVSYQSKHNDLNGESNRDGNDHNLSWNCGEEGESGIPVVLARRRHLQRALLATLFVAQGLPILQGGDELGRTQSGNNNAYCQDNALTWIDWEQADSDLLEFSARLIALRRAFPQLRQRRWLNGSAHASGACDIVWWHPDGRTMRDEDWHTPLQGVLGFTLAPLSAESGQRTLLVLLNRESGMLDFCLPPGQWQSLCNTHLDTPFMTGSVRGSLRLCGHSVQLLSQE